jgi:predicted dehydrogenase
MKHKIIFAGCGDIAFRWLDHITRRDDCEIIAIAETNEKRALDRCGQYNLSCPIYGSVDEALQKERGDLLVDLTYVTAHRDVVIKALKAGYDVLGEKPMAFDLESANEMLRAVDETGKRYILMQNRRYIDQVKKIRELVLSGQLGGPVMICGEIFVNADLASIRNQLEYPQLQDNNIHIFDQARYMVDGYPKSCYYHSFNPKGSQYKGDAAGAGIFEFGNGSVFSFRGCNSTEGCHTSWDHSWRVLCERGSILWDGRGDAYYEYEEQIGKHAYQSGVIKKPETVRDQHDGALEDLFDALDTGRAPGTDCKDNIHSIAMVFASLKSIKEKRRVDIEISGEYPYIALR